MYKFFEEKVKIIKNKFKNKDINFQEETIDLDEEVLNSLTSIAKEKDIELDILINLILTEELIKITKENKEYNKEFKDILDSVEYTYLLENDFDIASPILVINYENINEKVVSLSIEDYENTSTNKN